MKQTDLIRKVDGLGRIGIPVQLRRDMNIEMCDDIEIFSEDDFIILKKFYANKPCMITGQISENNREFVDGKIVLSPEGVRMLLKELREQKRSKNYFII